MRLLYARYVHEDLYTNNEIRHLTCVRVSLCVCALARSRACVCACLCMSVCVMRMFLLYKKDRVLNMLPRVLKIKIMFLSTFTLPLLYDV